MASQGRLRPGSEVKNHTQWLAVSVLARETTVGAHIFTVGTHIFLHGKCEPCVIAVNEKTLTLHGSCAKAAHRRRPGRALQRAAREAACNHAYYDILSRYTRQKVVPLARRGHKWRLCSIEGHTNSLLTELPCYQLPPLFGEAHMCDCKLVFGQMDLRTQNLCRRTRIVVVAKAPQSARGVSAQSVCAAPSMMAITSRTPRGTPLEDICTQTPGARSTQTLAPRPLGWPAA
eukprot:1867942-Pleurochrysis_carterae.AAC.2